MNILAARCWSVTGKEVVRAILSKGGRGFGPTEQHGIGDGVHLSHTYPRNSVANTVLDTLIGRERSIDDSPMLQGFCHVSLAQTLSNALLPQWKSA